MKDVPNIGGAPESANFRDAVHVAVISIVARERLSPGAHVKIEFGEARSTKGDDFVGVVDPFLGKELDAGDRFWLMLRPGTITSLRHQWTHPALDGDESTRKARQWIADFAEEMDQTYGRLMDAAQTWEYGEEYTFDNTEAYKCVDDAKWPTFWKHYEVVTGRKVKDHEATFFTCSC